MTWGSYASPCCTSSASDINIICLLPVTGFTAHDTTAAITVINRAKFIKAVSLFIFFRFEITQVKTNFSKIVIIFSKKNTSNHKLIIVDDAIINLISPCFSDIWFSGIS